ncbi:MAG TPA: chlorite dismutase family protein [Candidatus Saccharimonadales bacterium]|nr:chlorite dismutase family protein [Candidatus Saccharimonadales bacterium]
MTNHNYIFLKNNPSLNEVSEKTLAEYKKEFIKELSSSKKVICNTYSVLGLKTNANILIWFQADSIDAIQDLLNKLMHTSLGKHLRITYTLFGITRPTQYSPTSTGHLDTNRKGKQYLIIYPFTKTQEWYMLDFDLRRKLMGGHVMIGKKYQQIEQLLLYSYGIDDNEFIVSYETDELSAFQSLVIELRSNKVRNYTLKDTPIFTAIYKTAKEVVEYL